MSPHTPAPWAALVDRPLIVSPGQTAPNVVAKIAHVLIVSSAQLGETGADARLIAAAPELLAACMNLLWLCDQNGISNDVTDRALSVMEKATGVEK